MSVAALLYAVRSTVREALGLSDNDCDCRDSGAPINCNFNQQYFAVHPTGWLPGDLDNINSPGGINYDLALSVTITKKIGIAPPDRRFDTVFLSGIASFESQATTVINAIHQSQHVMELANSLIDNSPFLIIEPLRWQGCDPAPIDRTGIWIGAKSVSVVAQSLEVRFGGCRRTLSRNSALGQPLRSGLKNIGIGFEE